ncbi:hypothetical protein SARC_05958 [Sphaeroforma arctica JP610]|uniref:Uncharacterized protein n=1 Tax=Sphaeroforma arctica JP610 TaxID=667725 RepID=A0A0L0FY27_9EUKA|nr:hypothetical protein SARC_05958 [Sphaeroforma arctica JP610]KNC81735.1 hypothetical protein SARC_05958 [Sphaeroforma arctica JP610]|eukprot:XP_014155637.1 hypothetical protein SARC_05958 [Sphaeroforma arctica JP610]
MARQAQREQDDASPNVSHVTSSYDSQLSTIARAHSDHNNSTAQTHTLLDDFLPTAYLNPDDDHISHDFGYEPNLAAFALVSPSISPAVHYFGYERHLPDNDLHHTSTYSDVDMIFSDESTTTIPSARSVTAITGSTMTLLEASTLLCQTIPKTVNKPAKHQSGTTGLPQ